MQQNFMGRNGFSWFVGAAWFGLYVNSAAKEHDSDNNKK